MKCQLILAVLVTVLLAACGGDTAGPGPDIPGPPVPIGSIDGPFIVTVIEASDRCGLNPAEVGDVGEVDVRPRFDGLYDLVSWKAAFPSSQVQFDAVAVGVYGDVSHEAVYLDYYKREYPYRISGRLSPASFDLLLEHTDSDDCEFRVRLQGRPRSVADPASLDGFFLWEMESLGSWCPNEALPVNTQSSWSAIVEMRQFSDWLEVVVDKMIIFKMDIPTTGDPVTHSGQADDVFVRPPQITWVTWDGSLTASDISGVFTLGYIDESTGRCPGAYRIRGHKLLPSQNEVSGTYRAEYTVINSCPQEGEAASYSYYDTVVAVGQPNGSLRVFDTVSVFDLEPRSDGTYFFQVEGLFATETHTASFVSPYLDYRVLVEQVVDKGEPCRLTRTVRAVRRFLETADEQ